MTYSSKHAEHFKQSILGGGLSLQTLSSEERLRLALFLTVLGTHCISRSFPLPPQRMLASLASVSVAAGPASHAHGSRSTLGPRWVNRRLLGRHPWVPAQKSSTVGPHDQFSLLRARGNQTKLSTFDTVAFRVRRRPDRFHAHRRAPPLHSPCQKFGNTDYFFKLPAKR